MVRKKTARRTNATFLFYYCPRVRQNDPTFVFIAHLCKVAEMDRSDIMAAARTQAERAHRAAPIVMQINDAGGSAKISTQGYILLQSTMPNNIPELPSDLGPP